MLLFTVSGRTVIASLPSGVTIAERVVPYGGLRNSDIISLAEQLDVDSFWLAEQLNRVDVSGSNTTAMTFFGPNVAALAMLYGDNFTRIANIASRITNTLLRGIQEELAQNGEHLLKLNQSPPDSIPTDHVCVVCLHDAASTPGAEWVTAEGCARHAFHRGCMLQWIGLECMLCRAPLEMMLE